MNLEKCESARVPDLNAFIGQLFLPMVLISVLGVGELRLSGAASVRDLMNDFPLRLSKQLCSTFKTSCSIHYSHSQYNDSKILSSGNNLRL